MVSGEDRDGELINVRRGIMCFLSLAVTAACLASSAVNIFADGADGMFASVIYGDSMAVFPDADERAPSVNVFAPPSSLIEKEPADSVIKLPEITESENSFVNNSPIKDMSADSPSEIIDSTGRVGNITLPVGGFKPSTDGIGYGEKTVLLIHTHGTESYISEVPEYGDGNFRSDDPYSSVIAVGDAMAEVLEARGIGVIHCREAFDSESYTESYSRSREAVLAYLEEYPSIKYIFDIHRDAFTVNGIQAAATSEVMGKNAAQVMILVGSDSAGANHPWWVANLTLAMGLQRELFDRYEGLMRPVNVRCESFNQQLSSGFLLLEFGGCGNTLDEAEYSAALFGEVLADYILGEV